MSTKKKRTLRVAAKSVLKNEYFQAFGFVIGLLTVSLSFLLLGLRSTERPRPPLRLGSDFGLSGFESQIAWSYFQPAWERPELVSASSVENWSAQRLAEDPDHRIDKKTPIPTKLKGRVAFWVQVFGFVGSQSLILHDREDPGIVYGYLDFSSLYRRRLPTPLLERQMAKIEKEVFRQLKAKFLEATETTVKSDRSTQLKAFMDSIHLFTPEQVNLASENFRTQTGQRDNFLKALERSADLLPYIEAEFKKKGLPLLAARIPFVESSFNPKALSKDGAVGIWQILPQFSSEIFYGQDLERWDSDPIIQTKGAIRLLTRYKQVLPDWTTTITAYHSGVGRLMKLTQKFRARGIENLLSHPEFEGLGFAGVNFYSEVVAAGILEAYKNEVFAVPAVMTAPIARTTEKPVRYRYKGSCPVSG